MRRRLERSIETGIDIQMETTGYPDPRDSPRRDGGECAVDKTHCYRASEPDATTSEKAGRGLLQPVQGRRRRWGGQDDGRWAGMSRGGSSGAAQLYRAGSRG